MVLSQFKLSTVHAMERVNLHTSIMEGLRSTANICLISHHKVQSVDNIIQSIVEYKYVI